MPEPDDVIGDSRRLALRVRGLTCSRCVGLILDEMRALPAVEQVDVRLVPFGISLITVRLLGTLDPADQVRAKITGAGFAVVSRRRQGRWGKDPEEDRGNPIGLAQSRTGGVLAILTDS